MANYRNKKLTESAREEICVSCGIQDGTIVWAHSNEIKHGKGTGIKAHDLFGAYLCNECHLAFDSGKESKELKRELFREWWEQSLLIACRKGYL